MANVRVQGGNLDPTFQPGSELIYHDTGLIEGTVVIKIDNRSGGGTETLLNGYLGSRHPGDNNVFLYALRDRSLNLKVQEGTFDCIGTRNGQDTERIVVPVPSVEMVPIEAHPKFFTSVMAGAESALTLSTDGNFGLGSNGARFSVMNGQKKITGFLGFLGADAPASLRPVRMYQRNTPVLRSTWYSWSIPTFNCNSVIIIHPRGVPEMTGIANWLRSAPVAERVGAVDGETLWKLTQEYIGSEDGWNTEIYDTELE